MPTVSRRRFLVAGSASAVVPVVVVDRATAQAPPGGAPGAGPAASAAAPAGGWRFLTAPEAAFVEAAVDRLIPPDEIGPGAVEAGVAAYLDGQLAGAWGAGERLFRGGPWQPGTPTQGYQLPFTPAELYRTAMRGIREDLDRARRPAFEALPGDEQDAYLTLLQTTPRDLAGVPSNVFFESLLGMTIEGYFGDPVYGGNRGMAAWRMIGFPGAHGSFYDLVDRHGVAWEGAPRSLAETRGEVHLHPDIPAVAPVPGRGASGPGRPGR